MFTPQPFKRKPNIYRGKRVPIEELYPELTAEQQAQAEFFLLRYLEIVQRIFERSKRLTKPGESDTL